MTVTPSKSTNSLPDESGGMTVPAHPRGWRALFIGRTGIRAGWRFLMYAVGFVALTFFLQQVLNRIPGVAGIVSSVMEHHTLTPAAILIFDCVGIIATWIPALIMARVENRPWRTYGVPLQDAFGKLFWQGVIGGLAFETLVIVTISALGGFSFGTVALSGGSLVKYASLWAISFLLFGIQEEFRSRGYTQFTLASGIGFWPSAIVLAALSGIALLGPGATWVGGVEGTLFGLFACFTLQRTGNLWFAIGFCAATDFAETFIYSVPDSGFGATGQLLNSTLHGSRWLTGGAAGPQESAMSFLMLLVAFLVFARVFPAHEKRVEAKANIRRL